MKRLQIPLLTGALFAAGVLLFAYPTLSDWLARKSQSTAIQQYRLTVEEMDSRKLEEERQAAIRYNGLLAGTGIEDPFLPGSGMVLAEDYTAILNMNGIMGTIDIPKIGVSLPIYHGTGEEVLRKGVGHLKPTALPVGGEGSHCVLTGHRGLPSAKLFTDLDQMEIGDTFSLTVLDEVLHYQVDQILVIDPDDTGTLRPQVGQDTVTLITCTPYAINSHRLTVRGTRVFPEEAPQDEAVFPAVPISWEMSTIQIIRSLAVEALVLLLVLVLALPKMWRRRRR